MRLAVLGHGVIPFVQIGSERQWLGKVVFRDDQVRALVGVDRRRVYAGGAHRVGHARLQLCRGYAALRELQPRAAGATCGWWEILRTRSARRLFIKKGGRTHPGRGISPYQDEGASMPRSEPIVGLPGIEPVKFHGRLQQVVTTAELVGDPTCPDCQSTGPHRRKDTITRRIRHTSMGIRAHWLVIRVPKWRCRCGRYFRQRIPGVLHYQRVTEPFKEEVVERHEHGHSLARLQESHDISWATTERWVHQRYQHRVSQRAERVAPKVLGIDEHFFSRKQGFATTFADLTTHRVFDVQLGRSELSLHRFLDELPGKEATEVVVMDLSETYRAIVRRHFPNAMIVADRFHVIRLVGHCLMECWKQLEPTGRKNRGLISLMRRKPANLEPEQRARLATYLAEHPMVDAVYAQLQALMTLLRNKHQTAKQCRWHIRHFFRFIERLREAPMPALQTLANTLWSWRDPIARMWRFTKSNAITEGLHNKMEVISRRAYGFRNFQNYRLRVRALCG